MEATMARMDDQNDFSNVSWHSERNAAGEPASSGAPDSNPGPATPDFESSRQEARRDRASEPGHAGEILECTVSEPHKENDGTKDAYVSYLITTNVTCPPF
jgi:sorting nexin-4